MNEFPHLLQHEVSMDFHHMIYREKIYPDWIGVFGHLVLASCHFPGKCHHSKPIHIKWGCPQNSLLSVKAPYYDYKGEPQE